MLTGGKDRRRDKGGGFKVVAFDCRTLYISRRETLGFYEKS